MKSATPTTSRIVRIATAVLLLAGFAAFVGARLFPALSPLTVVVDAGLGVFALVAGLVVVAVVSLTFRQFILRRGGTDPQWFWFPREPDGLVRLREEARDAK